jgi:ABC-type xylose transport system substrate-binding protein
MNIFDTAMATALPALQSAFGEGDLDGSGDDNTVAYLPASGQRRLIAAIIDRGQLAPIGELGGKVGAVHAVLTIARSAIASINRGDAFAFADIKGGAVTCRWTASVPIPRSGFCE